MSTDFWYYHGFNRHFTIEVPTCGSIKACRLPSKGTAVSICRVTWPTKANRLMPWSLKLEFCIKFWLKQSLESQNPPKNNIINPLYSSKKSWWVGMRNLGPRIPAVAAEHSYNIFWTLRLVSQQRYTFLHWLQVRSIQKHRVNLSLALKVPMQDSM